MLSFRQKYADVELNEMQRYTSLQLQIAIWK